MTAKEFLSQAKYLDEAINDKIQQLGQLNDLATKATSVITGMPHSNGSSTSKLEDTVAKIIDLQNEINNDIDNLVDLKAEIIDVIRGVSSREFQTVLEKRYLCLMSWEKIAASMDYNIRWLYHLHSRALDEVDKIIKN